MKEWSQTLPQTRVAMDLFFKTSCRYLFFILFLMMMMMMMFLQAKSTSVKDALSKWVSARSRGEKKVIWCIYVIAVIEAPFRFIVLVSIIQEEKSGEKATEAKDIKLYGQIPPIDKMDASLSTLSNCEWVLQSLSCVTYGMYNESMGSFNMEQV